MNRIVKIPSNEGGVFVGTNNRLSFDIPEGKFYDLSKSYIQLISSIPVTSTTGVVRVKAFMDSDRDTGTGSTTFTHPNSVLIKNVSFQNQMGSVENIQRSDILSDIMSNYTTDDDAAQASQYQNLFVPYETSGSMNSIFNELHKEGSVVSKNLLRQPVRVKCSDILNFWKTKQYNGSKYGRSRLDLELNVDKVQVFQSLSGKYNGTGANFDAASLVQWEQGGLKRNNFINLTDTVGADHVSTRKLQIGVDAVATPFNRLEDQCLFWVGQQITIKGVIGAANGKNVANLDTGVVRTIQAIEYNRGETATDATGVGMTGAFNRNAITITLDAAITTGANLTGGETITGLQCVGVDATLSPFQIDYAELIMEEIMQPDMDGASDPIAYTTYSTEEFDTPTTQNFQRVFTCEPEAITLYITSPTGSTHGAQVSSQQNGLEQYRLRIDNKDTSGRFINMRKDGQRTNDPLHIQKQMTALTNSGKRVRNLIETETLLDDQTTIAVGFDDMNKRLRVVDDDNAMLLIGQVLPRTQREKQIQIIMNSATGKGVTRLALFKEVEKVI